MSSKAWLTLLMLVAILATLAAIILDLVLIWEKVHV